MDLSLQFERLTNSRILKYKIAPKTYATRDQKIILIQNTKSRNWYSERAKKHFKETGIKTDQSDSNTDTEKK